MTSWVVIMLGKIIGVYLDIDEAFRAGENLDAPSAHVAIQGWDNSMPIRAFELLHGTWVSIRA